MINMIKLDWSAMKYYHIRGLLLPFYLMLMGWFSPICLIPLGAIFMFAYSVNPFAVEEQGELNQLYLTLPIRRSTVVTGRYALSLLLFLAGVLIGLILMPLANLVSISKWYPDFTWFLALVCFSFLIHGTMSLAMYPMLFWLGYQKGKFWGFYLPGILFALAFVVLVEYDYIFSQGRLFHNLLTFASEHTLMVCGGMSLLGLVLLGVSFLLSLRIYRGREF